MDNKGWTWVFNSQKQNNSVERIKTVQGGMCYTVWNYLLQIVILKLKVRNEM